jgi:polar amino acid transport system substrate-binding protein
MEASMNQRPRPGALALAVVLLAVACAGPGATPTAPATSPASPTATVAGDPNDLLAKVKAAGEIRVSTDPNYAPQSVLKPDGTFEGFDIDVANEIGRRLGVTVKFETPDFDLVQGGNWADRWDLSVGSITITEERKAVLDFTQPYYYTPAQMTATTASGITTLEGLAGKTVCVAEATTYLDWIEGTLTLGDGSTPAEPPAGMKATTFPTDANCAEAVQAGRTDFEGFLTSSTTAQQAIDEGIQLVMVGDPVFYEPLAAALDKNGPPHAELLAEVDRIIGEMHADGTLTQLSMKHYKGLDLTKAQ